MNQTQLELDLEEKEQSKRQEFTGQTAQIVSFGIAQQHKQRRERSKLYDAILESIDHIAAPVEKQYK